VFLRKTAYANLGSSSPPVVVAQPDKRHANRTVLCWSGMTDRA